MENSRVVLFVLVLFFVFLLSGTVFAQLPPLELKVRETDGDMVREREDGSTQVLQNGDTLAVGEKIINRDGAAQLEIPGISILKIDSGTQLVARKLHRDTESAGMLGGLVFGEKEVTVNEIDIEAFRGKVINSIRTHKDVENDYQIITPTAVAGIRGTSFRCQIFDDNATEVSVLEGRVNFYNRFNPERRQELQARQRSRLRPDEEDPDEPEEIDKDDEQEIKDVKDEADKALLLRPVIDKVGIHNLKANRRLQIVYNE
ncbi:MAG: FecR domain-containing protein, partial [bacterium]